MKKIFLVVVMCGVMITLAACGGGGGGGKDVYTPSVYVVGSVSTGIGSNACYWKDGVRVDLEEDNKSRAFDIAVANGNIYVSGEYDNKCCYWVNGSRYNLSSAGSSNFSRIKVINGTVYISGTSSDGHACVWINGSISKVDDINSYAYGMEIINDTIYLVGGSKATIWKKQITDVSWTKWDIHQSGYTSSYAYAIAVNNETFYIAGYLYKDSNSYPALWTGNDLNTISSTELPMPDKDDDIYGNTYSIKIFNGQPYIAGHYNKDISNEKYSRASLWIGNNDPIVYAPEDEADSAAFGVYIYNGDIYVAGNIRININNYNSYIQPCYWKNGVRVDLPVPAESGSSITDNYISANAILVQ